MGIAGALNLIIEYAALGERCQDDGPHRQLTMAWTIPPIRRGTYLEREISALGDRIRYLPSPVGACAEATEAPSRWSRTRNVKA